MCRDHSTGARIPGISGVHVMAYRQEELVAEIIEEAGTSTASFSVIHGWPLTKLPGKEGLALWRPQLKFM